ncbi:MAG: hypothetical protein ACXAC8_16125 [Candidatus Hodarchaeales archaeon]|jgi:hypothetical protein
MLNNKRKLIIGLTFSILFVIPFTQQVSATVIWEEDFEVGPFDEWYLQGYNYTDVFEPIDYFPTIENGRLQMPNSRDWSINGSVALRNSTLAYGTWSFDWYITLGENHETFEDVWLLSNLALNQTGLAHDDPYLNAYILNMVSASPHPGDAFIVLSKITSGNLVELAEWDFDGPLEGSHHVEVTRDSTNGTFRVYFDNEFLFSKTDNSHTTSERFAIASWYGDGAFDNITLDNAIIDHTTTTESGSGFDWIILLFSLSVILIFFPKRRR